MRDHLAYRATAGHWSIEPAINASYEHFNEQTGIGYAVQTTSVYNGGSVLGIGSVTSVSEEQLDLKENPIILTPAIDISYKRMLDVQGGVLLNVGHQKGS